jgi:4-hydroxyphenylpyruvate dioxygenase-like putative hemolysin
MNFFFRTDNIIKAIEALRARGTEFLDIPNSYYNELKKRLGTSKVQVNEIENKIILNMFSNNSLNVYGR